MANALDSDSKDREFESLRADHVVASYISLAATFFLYLIESHLALIPLLLLSEASHAQVACSVVNALATALYRYQLASVKLI